MRRGVRRGSFRRDRIVFHNTACAKWSYEKCRYSVLEIEQTTYAGSQAFIGTFALGFSQLNGFERRVGVGGRHQPTV